MLKSAAEYPGENKAGNARTGGRLQFQIGWSEEAS